MLEMKPSLREEWPLCKDLWKTAFGDDDAYIDNYYNNYYRPERVVTLKDDGVLCGMLALFPLELRWPDGGVTRASYLYALAIHPEFQGQGLGTFLLRYADFYVGEQAVPFLSTVPAQPGLERFFAAAGAFQPCHPIDEATVDAPAPGPVPAQPVSAAQYRETREALLEGTGHAVYGEDYLEYQAKVSALSGGGLFKMDTPKGPACAVAELDGDRLDVRELLSPAGEQLAALAALTARFPAKTCRVRCPAGWGELPGAARRTFGMGKRVPPTPKILGETYFGLAFD